MAHQSISLINKLTKKLKRLIAQFLSSRKDSIDFSEDILDILSRFQKNYKRDFEKEVRSFLNSVKKGKKEIVDAIINEALKILEKSIESYKEAFEEYQNNNQHKSKKVQINHFSKWKSGILALSLSGYIFHKIALHIGSLNGATKAIWEKTTSRVPREEHLKNDGKEFFLDKGIDGELPGQLPNCKCGMSLCFNVI
jgi:uncharacterized protein YdiU (UPF0061 family)